MPLDLLHNDALGPQPDPAELQAHMRPCTGLLGMLRADRRTATMQHVAARLRRIRRTAPLTPKRQGARITCNLVGDQEEVWSRGMGCSCRRQLMLPKHLLTLELRHPWAHGFTQDSQMGMC